MTLLTPLNLLLATVAFLPPLVLLYLLKRRRSVRRVASVMFWPQAAEDLEANAPWRRFRFSWLLVVQAAALLLLGLAVSRPIADADSDSAQLILLVDVGASMGSRLSPSADGDGAATRLDLAKARAAAVADQWLESSPQGEVRIISFASDATLASGSLSDPRRVKAFLDGLAVSDQASRLGPAVTLASSLARRGETGGGNARVVLLSDGVLEPTSEALPTAEVAFIAIDAPAAGNAGITELAAARDPADPRRIEVFAKVVSTLPAGSQLPISLLIQGETVASRMLDLATADADAEGAAGRSEATAAFAFDLDGACLIEVRLPAGDSLAADDAAFASMPSASPLRIAMVAAGDAVDPFLLEGLAALQDAGAVLLDEREWRTQLDRLDPPADLLVLDGISLEEPPPLPTISFAASPPWMATPMDDGDPRGTVAQGVLRWNRRAELLRDIDLLGMQAARSLALVAHPLAVVLVEGTRGPLVASREIDGHRHLLVGFRPGDSTWPVDPSFVAFLANACDQLAAGGTGTDARIIRTGEPIELRCIAVADGVRLTGPDGDLLAASDCEDGRLLTIAPLARVGVHRLEGVAWPGTIPSDPPATLEVGASLLAEQESDNRPRRDWRLESEAAPASSARLPLALWPLLALAALALVVAEWQLYLRAARPAR